MPNQKTDLPSWRTPRAVALLAASLCLIGLTAFLLFGQVEHELSGEEIHQGRTVAFSYLPGPGGLWGSQPPIEVFEDGWPLGPRVGDQHEARALGGGAYALRTSPWSTASTVYFTASDGSRPRSNGRRYTVRYPRWRLPGSLLLVIVVWVGLALVGAGHSAPNMDRPMRVSAWCVVVASAIYSLFAVQAWLVPPNGWWLLAVGALALPPLLALPDRSIRWRRLPDSWLLWSVGLLLWMGLTCFSGSSYASRGTWIAVCFAGVWGSVVLIGFRERLAERIRIGPGPLIGLFLFVITLSLARSAGFELDRGLAALGLGQAWTGRILNPWTTKFLGHWTLVITWCTVVAIGLGEGRSRKVLGPRASVAAVIGLSCAAVLLSGSKTALVALACSGIVAAAATIWPRWTRRAVVAMVVLGLLTAPLLAALPWRAASSRSVVESRGALEVLELAARGSIWEFGRRLITERPLVGWGIGATRSLPGRELSVVEALGSPIGGMEPSLALRAVMPDGHPHSAALLIWLDLGLVGALLGSGLVLSVGRRIAVVEGVRSVHAALLALLTVTWGVIAFNYPLWKPEVLSILWMTCALPAAMLERREPSRRSVGRDGLLVALILMLGFVLVVHDRLARGQSLDASDGWGTNARPVLSLRSGEAGDRPDPERERGRWRGGGGGGNEGQLERVVEAADGAGACSGPSSET